MTDLNKNEKILIEEVKVIQEIIKRMASNSFHLKTWTVALIVVAILFRGDGQYSYAAYIPLFAFWYLDAFYLRQERLFRKVHDWVLQYRLKHDDRLFDLNPVRFNKEVAPVIQIMFTISTLPFYGAVFVLLTITILMPCIHLLL